MYKYMNIQPAADKNKRSVNNYLQFLWIYKLLVCVEIKWSVLFDSVNYLQYFSQISNKNIENDNWRNRSKQQKKNFSVSKSILSDL